MQDLCFECCYVVRYLLACHLGSAAHKGDISLDDVFFNTMRLDYEPLNAKVMNSRAIAVEKMLVQKVDECIGGKEMV